jgi:hypothetical protein
MLESLRTKFPHSLGRLRLLRELAPMSREDVADPSLNPLKIRMDTH